LLARESKRNKASASSSKLSITQLDKTRKWIEFMRISFMSMDNENTLGVKKSR